MEKDFFLDVSFIISSFHIIKDFYGENHVLFRCRLIAKLMILGYFLNWLPLLASNQAHTV